MYKCSRCGKEIQYYLTKDVLCDECFSDKFWEDALKDSNIIIAHGNLYHYSKHDYTGFSGRHFNLHYFDGRVIKDVGLWHNGEIPEKFKRLDTGAIEEV